ncbi:hypothetical protein QQP08_026551 [Theobroma cacao]|nr:hypothetical protein QQP08_026551 [Theobroma cacao]
MQTIRSGPSSVYKLLSGEPIGLSSANGNSSLTILQPCYEQSEAPASAPQASVSQPRDLIPNPVPHNSYIICHKSTRLCTGFHSSTSESSNTEKHVGNSRCSSPLPMFDHLIPATNTPDSSLLFGEGKTTTCDKEDFEKFMVFPHVPAENSTVIPEHSAYPKGTLTLKEQLQLQYLTRELEIEMNGNGSENENPGLAETHKVPRVATVPVIQLEHNRNCLSSVVNLDGCIHSTHQHPEAVAANKQRIRWMPKLHELFLNAVDKLGGPESELKHPE